MHLCGVRSVHRETVEEALFSFLLQDKQHTQPRSRRATEAPASDDGQGREGFRTEESDAEPGSAGASDRGQRHRAGGAGPRTAAAGRGAGLLHAGLGIH